MGKYGGQGERETPLWGGKPPGDVHGLRLRTHLLVEGWREITVHHTGMQWLKFYSL